MFLQGFFGKTLKHPDFSTSLDNLDFLSYDFWQSLSERKQIFVHGRD